MAWETDFYSKYRIGDQVPYHINLVLALLSFFVSLIGAYTTVELLHRRKTGNGWLSWLQLGGSSFSFGLVAIWGMHFVGNRAIILGDGAREIQLYYNAGFTILSMILPIMFLFFGFSVAERFSQTKKSLYISLIVTGLAAGLAITAMHYIGNFGTTNYKLSNKVGFILGAAAIAIFACWFAFTLFFHQKEHWINTWWRRALIAGILAGTVSGMHWTASVGTTYQLRNYQHGSITSRNQNAIIAVVMCTVACVVCFCLAFLGKRRRKQLADRAQHVVLASATFDPEGRLLVTQEGLMPCQKITKQYNQRSFNDEFNVAHPVFQWIFRVTHHWSGIADLVPAMRNHLRVNGNLKTPSRPGSTGTRSTWEDTIGEEDYSAIFREQFCVAASELAGHMDTDLQNLGILYEGILMTGTLTTEFKTKRSKYGFARGTIAAQVENKDIEAGLVTPSLFGKGQLLFVVRKADRAEASRLMSAGYRFAQTDQVSDQLARSMQINRQDLIDTVERLRDYCQRGSCMPSPGTYLACFALRAAFKTSGGSWDILVPKTNLCQLPMVALSSRHLELWQIDLLAQMDGLSVNQCIEHLRNQVRNRSDQKSEFMLHVLTKIAVLVKEVPEPFFQQAVFAARPIKTQRHVAGDGVPSQATIFAFCIIPDVHIASVKSDVLRYTPLSFFKCQQRVHAGSPDHAILAGKNHREFGSLLAQQKELSTLSVSSRRGSILAPRHVRGVRMWLSKNSSPRHPDVQPDNSSEKGLVSAAVRDDDNSCSNAFGGILVRKDIAVNSDVELKELGTTTEAGVAATEEPTFADELFKITSSKWQKS